MQYLYTTPSFSLLKLCHDPDDLCYWTSEKDDEGRPQSFHYQDDGFGNLILISNQNYRKLLAFKYSNCYH